jgi:hypothetical protein
MRIVDTFYFFTFLHLYFFHLLLIICELLCFSISDFRLLIDSFCDCVCTGTDVNSSTGVGVQHDPNGTVLRHW